MTREQLAKRIDHSRLRPNLSREDIARSCEEAKKLGCRSLYVLPANVKFAAQQLKGSGVKVASVVGFPLGVTFTEVKVAEAKMLVQNGAEEIDMVVNISDVLSGEWQEVEKDIHAVVVAAAGAPVKLILETYYLKDDQKIKLCQIATKAGAAYVKTSTGYTPLGATLHDIVLMRKYSGPDVKIKTAGGIHYFEDAVVMVENGADGIGASRSDQILNSKIE